MRWQRSLAVLTLAATALGQHAPPAGHATPSDHQKQPLPPPVHAPHPELPPTVALAQVRAANERAVAALAAGRPLPLPPPRPAGAGRFVVAVVTCADAAVDVAGLLGLRREDVLLISNAGATGDADATDLVTWAATEERLSLCIVLTHAGCRSLEPAPAVADGERGVPDRGAAARALAARRRIALERAQALAQRERLLGAAPELRRRCDTNQLFVAPASVDPRTGAITWHTTRAEELPLAPVK